MNILTCNVAYVECDETAWCVSAASSIVTTQSLAEAIATAIVVDALATPIVSSTNTAGVYVWASDV